MCASCEATQRATAKTRVEIRWTTNKWKFIEALVLAVRPIGGSDLQKWNQINQSVCTPLPEVSPPLLYPKRVALIFFEDAAQTRNDGLDTHVRDDSLCQEKQYTLNLFYGKPTVERNRSNILTRQTNFGEMYTIRHQHQNANTFRCRLLTRQIARRLFVFRTAAVRGDPAARLKIETGAGTYDVIGRCAITQT